MIMVIFGASGDLTRRKLMPALFRLYRLRRLPERFAVLGMARSAFDDESFRGRMRTGLLAFAGEGNAGQCELDRFLSCLYYYAADPSTADSYEGLKKILAGLDGMLGNPAHYLFYLATPPLLYGVVPKFLKSVGLNRGEKCIRRIVVEKPFGYDLASAVELNKVYTDAFDEGQIFRIDHFLGKETVQNILAFRFANSIFEPLWNRSFIDYVEITAVENLGIENRGGFYEGTGALRDMVQNHLIQLLAVTAMEPLPVFDADGFRNEVVKVYQALKPLDEAEVRTHVVRGQYTASGERKGYREEDLVDAASRTETYLAMRVEVDNWRWSGVPFYIRTAKQMPTKVTEIVIHFKPTPYPLFHGIDGADAPSNRLIIRIQPNEGIALRFGMKKPGSGFDIVLMDMDFSYKQLGDLPQADAYARLIEDCMAGDQTLFTRSDAVEASWRYFEPVINCWHTHPDVPLYGYPAGTWGPPEADRLMAGKGVSWTNPCKNLTETNLYCEL